METKTMPITPDNGTDTNAAAATAAALQPNRRALAGLLQMMLVLHRSSGRVIDKDLADLLHNIPTALADDFQWEWFSSCWEDWTEQAGQWVMGHYATQLEILSLMDERRAQTANKEGN